jgi:hypothetical protein
MCNAKWEETDTPEKTYAAKDSHPLIHEDGSAGKPYQKQISSNIKTSYQNILCGLFPEKDMC